MTKKFKKREFPVSRKKYLKAQDKAYKLWCKILSDEPKWAFDYHLNKNIYIAFAKNPEPHYSVVTHNTSINTATGMFRFPNQETADKFILKMGKSMKYLFPNLSIKVK